MKKLVLLAMLLTTLAACNGPKSGAGEQTRTLATFQGGSLTELDVQAHYEHLRKDARFRNHPESLTPETVFEHALNMEMMIALGLEKQLHLDPRVRQQIHAHMSDLFLRLLQDELVERIERDQISDEEALAYYNAHKDQYQKKALYQVRVLTAAAETLALAAAAVRDEGLPFAEAVRIHAADEQERESGGTTGSRSLERFRPAWREHVARLQVGELYGPVEIDGQQRLLWLDSRTEPYQYSFEEKKEYVRNDCLYQKYREAWQAVYDELRTRFSVKIDDKTLRQFYETMAAEKKGEA